MRKSSVIFVAALASLFVLSLAAFAKGEKCPCTCSTCICNNDQAVLNPTTEILFILDESGSMNPLQSDTIGGYNSFIEKQKAKPGQTWLTTVLFNSDYRRIVDRVPIKEAPKMDDKVYSPTSTTALYDAIGRGLSDLDRFRKSSDSPSDKVIVVIVTDGEENSSEEYNLSQVKKMIADRTKRGWEFIYMGANVESAKEASRIGIAPTNAMDFSATGRGLKQAFDSAESAVDNMRKTGSLGQWKKNDAPQPEPSE